jgi:hypothetical protein
MLFANRRLPSLNHPCHGRRRSVNDRTYDAVFIGRISTAQRLLLNRTMLMRIAIMFGALGNL